MGGDAHPDERRAAAKANRVRRPRGCRGERTGEAEGEIVDRLRTEPRPVVWHNGGLESDSVGGRGVVIHGSVKPAKRHQLV